MCPITFHAKPDLVAGVSTNTESIFPINPLAQLVAGKTRAGKGLHAEYIEAHFPIACSLSHPPQIACFYTSLLFLHEAPLNCLGAMLICLHQNPSNWQESTSHSEVYKINLSISRVLTEAPLERIFLRWKVLCNRV